MGKQSIVIRVAMEDAKERSKALRIVVGFTGVLSAALEGDEHDRIALVGDGVDAVNLTKKLRKKMGFAELVKVEEKKDQKKEEKKEEKKDEGKSVHQVVWPYQFHTPYPYNTYEIREPDYDQSCCMM